jgi:phosphate transport system substrate-binding protein
MKITARWLASSLGFLALTAGTAVLLSSCSPAQSRPQATIKIDGSSTVYPITNAIAAEFQATQANKQQADGVNVTVDVSGTSGGFRKFCEGVTDISNASPPLCKRSGRYLVERLKST